MTPGSRAKAGIRGGFSTKARVCGTVERSGNVETSLIFLFRYFFLLKPMVGGRALVFVSRQMCFVSVSSYRRGVIIIFLKPSTWSEEGLSCSCIVR
jgi:hypothetical protein